MGEEPLLAKLMLDDSDDFMTGCDGDDEGAEDDGDDDWDTDSDNDDSSDRLIRIRYRMGCGDFIIGFL